MIKTGKTKEEQSFLSKFLLCSLRMIERKKKKNKEKKRKTSIYVNERTAFLLFYFFLSIFTLVSDVFEKKSAKKPNTFRYVKTKENEVQMFISDITCQNSAHI